MQYAPPVVSIRSRCVQESKCVYLHAHTHALAVAGVEYRWVQDYSSQPAVNTDKYSIRPVLPTAVRELGQAQCFPPSCERPGVLSAVWGAWVLMASGPNSAWSCCCTKRIGEERLPARRLPHRQFTPLCSARSACCRRQGFRVRIKKRRIIRKKKIASEII